MTTTILSTDDPQTWCHHCGHPVAAEGITFASDYDYDRTDAGRARCNDTACESDAAAGVE